MRAMILKEFRELRRDRRTVGMLIGMPLLLLIVFGYAANFTITSVDTAVVGPQAQQVADQLPDFFVVTEVDESGDRASAETLVVDNTVDVAVVTGAQPPTALVDGSNLFAAQAAVSVLNRMGDPVQTEILFNPDLNTSWVMIPAIIGLILTFIGTIVTSIGMVRERETGTLEQLAVMPIKPSSVILGKITPYFVLASIDMLVVTVLGILLFDVPFNGSPGGLRAGGSPVPLRRPRARDLHLHDLPERRSGDPDGVLLPASADPALRDDLPPRGDPWGVRWISYLLPLTYFTMISQGVMIRGAPLNSLLLPFAALTVMAVVVFTGAVMRFRRTSPRGHKHHGAPALDGDWRRLTPRSRVPDRECPTRREPWRPARQGPDRAVVDYDGKVALDDVSLDAAPGAMTAIVGGDGAGKTTLLRLLVGRVPLASGTVEVPDLASVGYLPATVGCWVGLTVQQNIDFVGGVVRCAERQAGATG